MIQLIPSIRAFSLEDEPLFVFGIIMLIILVSQIFLQRFRVPSLVGYILAGMVLGPKGLSWFLPDRGIDLIGTAGLLYILFTAGLELNLSEFRKKKTHSLLFGFLTFSIPLLIGYFACIYILKINFLGAILVSSMFSTHTLVAYPIVARYQLQKNDAVGATVGGTIFTDTAVLLLLAFIVAFHEGKGGMVEMVKITLMAVGMVTSILWIYPQIGRWFFRHNSEDRNSGIVFLLLLMFTAGIISKMIGLEPIIGAFLAGIALNRQVAGNLILHKRIEFLGASLFIPFFLISVGMVVDLKLLLEGKSAWYTAIVLIAVAFAGKWLAAFLSQKILSYSALQRKLMFGLSSSHAAATIAVIFIGYRIGLINIDILNGTILLILISCLVSAIITESSARKLALFENENPLDVPLQPDRILVPLSNPSTADRLIDAALVLRDKKAEKESIFALAIIEENGPQFEQTLLRTRKFLNELTIKHAENEKYLRTLIKIEVNVVSGIIKTMKEIQSNTLVLGWGGLPTTSDRIFGNLLQRLIDEAFEMVVVTRHRQAIHNFKVIKIFIPPNAEYETGFISMVHKLIDLAAAIQARLDIISEKNLSKYFSLISQRARISCEYRQIAAQNWNEIVLQPPELGQIDTLFIYVMARMGTLSFQNAHENLPNFLANLHEKISFIAIYPRQSPMMKQTGVIPAEEIFIPPISSRLAKFKEILTRVKILKKHI